MDSATLHSILDALESELNRSVDTLKVPGHPKTYFLSYLVRDVRSLYILGRFGALCKVRPEHQRTAFADVRVGTYKFDQTSQGGLGDHADDVDSYEYLDLPLDADSQALRHSLWRLTDARFREAVAAYHERKSRQISFKENSNERISFSRQPACVDIQAPNLVEPNAAYWEKYIRRTSGFLRQFKELKNTSVEFHSQVTLKIFVSSEGRKLVWPTENHTLSANLWGLTQEGEPNELDLSYHAASVEELPSARQFEAALAERVQLLNQLKSAPRMRSYSGPVLLAPKPAGLFIHEVLGHRLEGNRMLCDDEGQTFRDKMDRAITTPHLSIVDDPSLSHFEDQSLVGHYSYDDEGVQGQKVCLVRKGILENLLTSRAPLKKGHQSNGHARNEHHERPISRMANLIATPHAGTSWEELKQALLKEVARKNLEYGMILLEAEDGETGTEAYDFQAFLGRITVAKKIYLDGTEELVRGVDFVGTPLTSLSQISAVGSSLHVDNSYCGAESGTIPVSTIAPAMLVDSMELQAQETVRLTPYVLPLPWDTDEENSADQQLPPIPMPTKRKKSDAAQTKAPRRAARNSSHKHAPVK